MHTTGIACDSKGQTTVWEQHKSMDVRTGVRLFIGESHLFAAIADHDARAREPGVRPLLAICF